MLKGEGVGADLIEYANDGASAPLLPLYEGVPTRGRYEQTNRLHPCRTDKKRKEDPGKENDPDLCR